MTGVQTCALPIYLCRYTVQNLFNGKGLNTDTGRDHFVNSEKIEATHFSKIENEPWRVLTDALPHESVARGLVLYPEGYKAQATAANNVWIRMKVNEKTSDPTQVIKIGDLLPIEKSDGIINISFKGTRYIYEYNIDIEVLTGESIETAEIWKSRHDFNFRSKILLLDAVLIGVNTLIPFDYVFKLEYNFKGFEDGTISFYSKLYKDTLEPVEISF